MRTSRFHSTGRIAGAAALAIAATVASLPATAGGLHDHVYADSFGNLIVRSPAGYKRIVVGQGHLAEELAAYERAGVPEVVYADPYDHALVRRCRAPGVLLHGRSYMYGLPDNVVPVLEHPCR